jgi:hypothetical protein
MIALSLMESNSRTETTVAFGGIAVAATVLFFAGFELPKRLSSILEPLLTTLYFLEFLEPSLLVSDTIAQLCSTKSWKTVTLGPRGLFQIA